MNLFQDDVTIMTAQEIMQIYSYY